ncbi:TolC family protein [Marinicella sediminis]|uniref:TolC family protein n=1 Tax=Marinicella sediminis TaxID=1792834 RepID=A0ABV7JCY4_9GAMM|nr:TolC family protein [Marinicella sediminis]
MNNNGIYFIFMVFLISLTPLKVRSQSDTDSTLSSIVSEVWARDAELKSLLARRDESSALAQQAAALPNLMFSADLNNLTLDGLDFNQEPMSQLRLGLAQQLPRGNSRQLTTALYQQQGHALRWQAEHRRFTLLEQTATLILGIQQTHSDLSLNDQRQHAIEDLLALSEAAYRNAYGAVKQQDLIEAELELLQNEDRQQQLEQRLNELQAELAAMMFSSQAVTQHRRVRVSTTAVNIPSVDTKQMSWQALLRHPGIQAANERLIKAQTAVELAEQQKKPAVTLKTSYGYRDDAPNGLNRDDLFSIGFSMDLPGFNKQRSGDLIKAKVSALQAAEADREALLRELHKTWLASQQSLQSQLQRTTLYQQQLLPQLKQLADVQMTAYANEGADFADVLRAQLSWYHARSTLNQLHTQTRLLQLKLLLLTASDSRQLLDQLSAQGDNHED